MEDIKQNLAYIEHERWSKWMKYLFTKGIFNTDGSFTINADFVERWKRQSETPYNELPYNERESDIMEVNKTLRYISTWFFYISNVGIDGVEDENT